MLEVRPTTPEQAAFSAELAGAGLLIATPVPGLFGTSAAFEAIRERVDVRISAAAAPDGAEQLRFPPLMARRHLEDVDYLASFPHLAGSVFAFAGDEADAAEQRERALRHEDWSEHQAMTDLVLVPAACYPVYPAIAARGPLPPGGIVVDAGAAWVFRREPSGDPARMQAFHQREIVRIGAPEDVCAWCDGWRERAVELLRGLGLDARADVASDPFFGRAGRLLARSQRSQALKFEVLVPIASEEPTAVASFNYHQEHFAEAFGLVLDDGAPAHTACLGFGHERIVLALLRRHGTDPAAWPAAVRRELAA
ncbi:MAG: amino acid--[acyl-carrier-protein] ligase [Solirubrobacteraceae bacterium]